LSAAQDYWLPKVKGRAYSDGYHYPLSIVYMGHQVWKRTGIIPDPKTLLQIDPRWLSDLLTRDDLVESARPKPESQP
jgi:hypothetical protein